MEACNMQIYYSLNVGSNTDSQGQIPRQQMAGYQPHR